MNDNIDYCVLIMRAQPFHNEHLNLVKSALEKCCKVIVCLGSANSPRTIKNPWTADERQIMMLSTLSDDEAERIHFAHIEDRLYQNQEWATLVRSAVRTISNNSNKISLIVAEKDDTSWYINLFPEWKKINITINNLGGKPLGATKIRELLFTGYADYVKTVMPQAVFKFILDFIKTKDFDLLKEEYESGIKYEKMYENNPKDHVITFFTVDSVVVQSGHILLIKRKNNPGKSLYALPGGFVEANETSSDASIRELFEETNIKVPEKVLRGSLKDSKLFEHPDRSLRCRITKNNARTITMAYCYKLDDTQELPRVKSDGVETELAWWFPVETVKNMRSQIMEDHSDIVNYFISRLDK